MLELRKSAWTVFKEYGLTTLGMLCYVLGWSIFLLPNNLVGGGVSGISAIIFYALGLPMGYTYFVINLILLLMGFKIMGGGFGGCTINLVSEELYDNFVKVVKAKYKEKFGKEPVIIDVVIGDGSRKLC